MDPHINIQFIQNKSKVNEKEYVKDTYRSVLRKIHTRIEQFACVHKTICSYTIPLIMIDRPGYKPQECLRYCYNLLVEDGFKVTTRNPDKIIISWDHPVEDTRHSDSKSNKTYDLDFLL